MRARRQVYEGRPNALLTILVDRLFHCPLVVLRPGMKQRNPPRSLFFRKELAADKEQHHLAD